MALSHVTTPATTLCHRLFCESIQARQRKHTDIDVYASSVTIARHPKQYYNVGPQECHNVSIVPGLRYDDGLPTFLGTITVVSTMGVKSRWAIAFLMVVADVGRLAFFTPATSSASCSVQTRTNVHPQGQMKRRCV